MATNPNPTTTPDVNSWYRTTLGRDGDAGGIKFWQDQIAAGGSAEDAYNSFKTAATQNKENVSTGYNAGSTYDGPMTSNSGSTVDDWGRNVLGRDLTAKESQIWGDRLGGAGNVADYNRAYGDFQSQYGKNGMSVADASRMSFSKTFNPALAQTSTPATAQAAPPAFNLAAVQEAPAQQWTVDPKTQTVAGQLQSILASDSPLMTQARARALQQQNASGRLNSTMAQSAGDSAMYDTALQIATPDAQMYGNSAKFNAGEANTFSRDSNQFQRDGAMAQFNVSANDWSAQQNATRTSERDATLDRYTLNRDAAQNDYQAVRDSTLNNNQTARDATLHGYSLAEVAASTATQNARDDKLNANSITAAETAAKTASNAASTSRLYTAKADFATAVDRITADPNMEAPAREAAISNLRTSYNSIITQAALDLKWDVDTWIIKGDFSTGIAPTNPVALPATTFEDLSSS